MTGDPYYENRIAELKAKLEVQTEWLKEADAVDKDNKAKLEEVTALHAKEIEVHVREYEALKVAATKSLGEPGADGTYPYVAQNELAALLEVGSKLCTCSATLGACELHRAQRARTGGEG